MTDNFTGVQPPQGNQPDWSPGGNSGLSQMETPGSNLGGTNLGGNSTQEFDSATSGVHDYKEKVVEAVSQAKDYLGEKATAVGGKIKDFATDDLSGLATKAKDFARQNPGQAILVSAGVGLLLGLIVRGRR